MTDAVATCGGAGEAAHRILLGGATFGGIGSLPDLVGRGEDRETAFALMSEGWDGGIRWFDTADAYGGGPRASAGSAIGSESRGTFPGSRRRRTTRWNRPQITDCRESGSCGQIASSLDRLAVDRLDMYLLHEFDHATPLAETMGVLEELESQGAIGAYGVSNFSAEQLASALMAGRPALVQNSYSLLNRRDELDVIPLCVEHGIAYQAYSPLAGGWLSGKYRRDRPVPPDSRLALVPQWYEHIDGSEAFTAIESLTAIGESDDVSIAALALAWVHHQPHVSEMVVGPRSRRLSERSGRQPVAVSG